MEKQTQMFPIVTPEGLEELVCAEDILQNYLLRMNHDMATQHTYIHTHTPPTPSACQAETPNGREEAFKRWAFRKNIINEEELVRPAALKV